MLQTKLRPAHILTAIIAILAIAAYPQAGFSSTACTGTTSWSLQGGTAMTW
jgi:hypothetical protein